MTAFSIIWITYMFQVPLGIPYRAWRTLPWRYFRIQNSSLPAAGLGVFATTFIAKNTWLGEYEGELLTGPIGDYDSGLDLSYAWQVCTGLVS
jgi:hypothetical protein